ncbi:ABC transporter permease [Cryobacterium sp. M91]|uniref:ABC transporter permease n=1 Tax=Cryobacterium sp. M91 TaxID=2048294 RepID=UPI000CE4A95C|nr:ABC transporter permease [Cryobacterium sp. M91]
MSDKTPGRRGPILEVPLPTEAISLRQKPSGEPESFFGRMNYNLQFIRGRGALEISIVLIVLLAGYVTASLISPTGFAFLNPNNLSGVISQSVPVLAILGLAAGILMIAGEFDLSLGANITLSAIVFIKTSEGAGLWLGIAAGIATGIAVALVNGIIVVYTKIPSFIATLGMSFFWMGAGIFINGTSPAALTTSREGTMEYLFAHNFGSFRSQLVWLLIIGVLAWFFMHRHKLGNHIFAVGGNPAAAEAISIKTKRVKLMSFAIFGGLVGFAAILIAVRTSSIQPGGTATEDFTLFAIAAAVVGGTSLTGGRGSVIGIIVGAALIELIRNGLLLAKAPGFYITLFVGVTIVIAAIFNKLMEGKAR